VARGFLHHRFVTDATEDQNQGETLEPCDYCDQPFAGKRFVSLDVYRPAIGTEGDDPGPDRDEDRWNRRVSLIFCSQEHAARYFAERILPGPEEFEPVPYRSDRSDLVWIVMAVLLFLWVLVMTVIGSVATVRRIWDN
jgi:hypothetical protein